MKETVCDRVTDLLLKIALTLFFCSVLDGGALSRHLVPKKADEENSRQGVQAGQGEEQQVQFIDRVENK